MFVGIDVGGTYTDAVLLTEEKVIKKGKFPTLHEDLAKSLLSALDYVIADIDTSALKRVVISTTLITNLIAEEKNDPIALVLMPGPGLSPHDYNFSEQTYILRGAIDYRGREILSIDEDQVNETIKQIKDSDTGRVAITGKFSCRNNKHELKVGEIFEEAGLDFELGHRVSGQLNFLRRAATTILTVATRNEHNHFVDYVKRAMAARNIKAPIFILKADGGTLPLEASKNVPVETIFSGPAASTLGAMSLTPKDSTSVVVDIGGTTTDLALILEGKPLLSSKGVKIKDYYTSVISFAVRSVPVGGDSAVVVTDGKLNLLAERRGPAFCLGGSFVTPTDALVVLGSFNHGNKDRAIKGLAKIADDLGLDIKSVAKAILDKVTDKMVEAINDMFLSWEQEPAYRIWELMQPTKVRPQNVVGVGGAALGIIPEVARKMGCQPIIPEHSEVANAIGAAVAEPTLKATLRIDTGEGYFTVAESGFRGSIPELPSFKEEQAIRLAKENLQSMAQKMELRSNEIEVVHSEVFNVIRGFTTAGRIYDVVVQTPRRILTYFHEQGVKV